jgi:hypothetical protein
MRFPGLTATASLYRSDIQYASAAAAPSGAASTVVPAQLCLPPGLCAKASRCCRRGDEGWCCDILDRCFDCFE